MMTFLNLNPFYSIQSQQQSSQQQSQSQQQSSSQGSASGSQSGSQQQSTSVSLQVTVVTTVVLSTSYHNGPYFTNGETVTTSFGRPTSVTVTETLTITPTTAKAKATTSTTMPPKSTAPTSINGGGNEAPNGAPSPGETGSNGIYGPNNSYIAAAVVPTANAAIMVVAGLVAGGAMVLA